MPAMVLVVDPTQFWIPSMSREVFCGEVFHSARASFWVNEPVAVWNFCRTRSTPAYPPRPRMMSV